MSDDEYWAMEYNKDLSFLVGRTVQEIWWSNEYTVFITDAEAIGYHINSECCSESYFHSLHDMWNMIDGGPISEVKALPTQYFKLENPKDFDNDVMSCTYLQFVMKNGTSSVLSYRGKYGACCDGGEGFVAMTNPHRVSLRDLEMLLDDVKETKVPRNWKRV